MMEAVGNIVGVKNDVAYITASISPYIIEKQKIKQCRVVYDDGRTISADQRKKAYATMRDISVWLGYMPEEMKEHLKFEFVARYGCDYFSFSNCSVSTATDFISFLIDFCFENNIPTRDTLLNRADDISRYLYSCLANRKCCICNAKGEVHHCDGSRVGMGFNRQKINNVGRYAICLCRRHHNEAHNDEVGFLAKNKVYGIQLDEYLVKKLKL